MAEAQSGTTNVPRIDISWVGWVEWAISGKGSLQGSLQSVKSWWFAAVRVRFLALSLTDHQAPQAVLLVQKCVEVLLL